MSNIKEKLKWTTQQRKINDLVPFEQNPRTMTEEQVKKLKESLEEFDLVEIPAIDTDNKIVAGHQRLKVMQLLGRGEEVIDVRIPNRKLTATEFKRYLIRSNKNTGSWDYSLLATLSDIEELKELGFTDRELDNVDFSELDDIDFNQEEADKDGAVKFEVLFASKEDLNRFTKKLKLIQKNFYPESSLSDGLFKYLDKNVADD